MRFHTVQMEKDVEDFQEKTPITDWFTTWISSLRCKLFAFQEIIYAAEQSSNTFISWA